MNMLEFEKVCVARHAKTEAEIRSVKSELVNDIKELKDGQKIIFSRLNWFYTLVISALLVQFVRCESTQQLLYKLTHREKSVNGTTAYNTKRDVVSEKVLYRHWWVGAE